MRILHLLPLVALTASLGACGGTKNQGMESVHQAVVSRTDYVYDINDGFGPQASGRLAAWFDSLNIRYGDRVSVDDPSDSASNRAAVAAVANRYGLTVYDTAPVTEGAVAPGMIRVVVSRSKAEVPGCPDWSRSSIGNYNSDAPSNYGCAVNASLAAMIADPNDLVSGAHAASFGDNTTGSNAIRKLKTPTAK
jgi:pilus assembly protein CpaD